MKIGIQTLQLNTNYGGILQAYALQTVLQRMGHDASVITKFSIFAFPLWMYPLALGFRLVKKYILGQKNIVIFNVKKRKEEAVIVRQHTQRFIDTYINKLECERFISLPENCVDAIVVGSDQVWRPRYFGKKIIADAYLEFARGWDIKRLSYAASFGTAEWEYSESQTAKCKELIAKFDAVSVREESAVGLCKDHFGVEAQHLLDPTMLLSKEDYIELVEKNATPKSAGDLMVYILDDTADKQAVVDAVAKIKGLTPFRSNSKAESGNAPLEERIQPPLEQWLRGFMDAEFVVADSFHACVFSIIFNKPFIALCNKARGASRFESLLKIFGLEDRLIETSQELTAEHMSDIDYQQVNKIKETWVAKSMAFLSKLN
ncbi:MAG: polysaccharide pyruvyl transferase family protein [Rikenellaceae bacterium]